MTSDEAGGDALAYSREEILSYLPAGWNLAGPDGDGAYDPAAETWRIAVRDGAGMDWSLTVRRSEVEARGRLEALRAAADRLYRRALS